MAARGRARSSLTARSLRQRLILTAPDGVGGKRLAAALAAGDVAAVVIDLGPLAPEQVVAIQAGGAAALVAASAWPAPHGADGLHLAVDRVSQLRKRPEGAICGAHAADRHGAMVIGEAGADYVWFDGAGDTQAACALGAWWSEMFEVPAVVAGPSDALAAMIGTRAEFVAMVDAFDGLGDEAALVNAANAALDAAQEAG
ncbi:MAG: thiamine phosphate synthase [Pseudomonadota bacterium]